LEGRPLVVGDGKGPIDVFVYDVDALGLGELSAFPYLPLDGFLSLFVARITSVNDPTHKAKPPDLVLEALFPYVLLNA
jgi:hypothetical protein